MKKVYAAIAATALCMPLPFVPATMASAAKPSHSCETSGVVMTCTYTNGAQCRSGVDMIVGQGYTLLSDCVKISNKEFVFTFMF